jgi:phage terminase large subunit-like protein
VAVWEDLTRGERNIAWIESVCRVPEGALVGQPVVLREWQREIIRSIYDQDTRRAIVSFGRKNGKTALAAFLLLLHLCGPEARPNSQLYSAAQSREQAAILFALAAKVVRQSPDLSQYVVVRDTAKQLACAEIGTLYRALSAEASTAYGLSPVFVVHDELGQVKGPRSELYEALETASGAQEAPLSLVISTQAPTDADLLSLLIDDAKANGDPRTRLFLYTASEELDPFSEDAIKAANPAYGDFQNPVEVRDQAEAARRMPSAENSYRNLILNQRVNMHNPFVSREVWERNAGAISDDPFKAGPVFLGLDLSARNDLTAMVAVAKDAEGLWHVRSQFFTPLNGLSDRSKRDRTPYDVWVKQGWMEATPGATVDYEVVADRLLAWCDSMPVQLVAFDRWRMDELKACIARRGRELPMEPFGQGMVSMAPALDVIEAELLNTRVRHGGHPVLRMCAANAVVVSDAAGNRKLDKSKATGRIDGMVALVMALGVAAKAQAEAKPSYQMLFV